MAVRTAERVVALLKRIAREQHDTEDVHQLRLCLRRLETSLACAGDAKAGKQRDLLTLLRKIRRRAGRMRDCEIAERVLARITRASAAPVRAGARALREGIRKRLQHAEKRLVRLAARGRSQGIDEDVASVLKRNATGKAQVTMGIAQAISKFEREMRTGVGTPEQMHRVRIAIKRVRYALEVDLPARGSPEATMAALARTVGRVMGVAMDVRVLIDAIDEHAAEHPAQIVAMKPLRARAERAWESERKKAVRELERFARRIGSIQTAVTAG